MTPDQLQTLVRAGESESLEFKQTTGQRSDAARTLCAMLNQRGGRVLFGVRPDRATPGQQVTDKTIEDIHHETRLIDPPAFPTIDCVTIAPDRQVIMVTVGQGPQRPYSYKGKAYRRVGTSTQEMTRDEYNRMLLERLHAISRWENEWPRGGDSTSSTRISRISYLPQVVFRKRLEMSIARQRSRERGARHAEEGHDRGALGRRGDGPRRRAGGEHGRADQAGPR